MLETPNNDPLATNPDSFEARALKQGNETIQTSPMGTEERVKVEQADAIKQARTILGKTGLLGQYSDLLGNALQTLRIGAEVENGITNQQDPSKERGSVFTMYMQNGHSINLETTVDWQKLANAVADALNGVPLDAVQRGLSDIAARIKNGDFREKPPVLLYDIAISDTSPLTDTAVNPSTTKGQGRSKKGTEKPEENVLPLAENAPEGEKRLCPGKTYAEDELFIKEGEMWCSFTDKSLVPSFYINAHATEIVGATLPLAQKAPIGQLRKLAGENGERFRKTGVGKWVTGHSESSKREVRDEFINRYCAAMIEGIDGPDDKESRQQEAYKVGASYLYKLYDAGPTTLHGYMQSHEDVSMGWEWHTRNAWNNHFFNFIDGCWKARTEKGGWELPAAVQTRNPTSFNFNPKLREIYSNLNQLNRYINGQLPAPPQLN